MIGYPSLSNSPDRRHNVCHFCRVALNLATGVSITTAVAFTRLTTTKSVVSEVVRNFAHRNGLHQIDENSCTLGYRHVTADGSAFLDFLAEDSFLMDVPYVQASVAAREDAMFYLVPKVTQIPSTSPRYMMAVEGGGGDDPLPSPYRSSLSPSRPRNEPTNRIPGEAPSEEVRIQEQHPIAEEETVVAQDPTISAEISRKKRKRRNRDLPEGLAAAVEEVDANSVPLESASPRRGFAAAFRKQPVAVASTAATLPSAEEPFIAATSNERGVAISTPSQGVLPSSPKYSSAATESTGIQTLPDTATPIQLVALKEREALLRDLAIELERTSALAEALQKENERLQSTVAGLGSQLHLTESTGQVPHDVDADHDGTVLTEAPPVFSSRKSGVLPLIPPRKPIPSSQVTLSGMQDTNTSHQTGETVDLSVFDDCEEVFELPMEGDVHATVTPNDRQGNLASPPRGRQSDGDVSSETPTETTTWNSERDAFNGPVIALNVASASKPQQIAQAVPLPDNKFPLVTERKNVVIRPDQGFPQQEPHQLETSRITSVPGSSHVPTSHTQSMHRSDLRPVGDARDELSPSRMSNHSVRLVVKIHPLLPIQAFPESEIL